MKKLIYLSLALFVIACASKKTVPVTPTAPAPPTAQTEPRSMSPESLAPTTVISAENFRSPIANFTFAEFQKGKVLYETKCNGCHALIPPAAKPTSVWQKLVPIMVGKYNMKNSDFLDEAATQMINGYLVTVTTK